MRRGRSAVVIITALLATSGCSGSGANPTDAQRSPGSGDRAGAATTGQRSVDWTDDYCEAVAGLVDAISVAPRVDPSTPRRAAATSIEMLAGVIDGLNGIVRRLDALDPSPVDGGDEAAGTAIGTFIGIRNRAQEAQGRLSAAPVGTDQARRALDVTSAVLDEIGQADLLGGVNSIPELAEGVRDAPACRQLTRGEPSPRMGGAPDPAQTRTN